MERCDGTDLNDAHKHAHPKDLPQVRKLIVSPPTLQLELSVTTKSHGRDKLIRVCKRVKALQ